MPQKEVLYFTPVQYKIQLTFVAGIRFFFAELRRFLYHPI